MPNYEIVKGYCNSRKKDAVLPATYVSEHKGSKKLCRTINDCLSKDPDCQKIGCKFAKGDKEPHLHLPE